MQFQNLIAATTALALVACVQPASMEDPGALDATRRPDTTTIYDVASSSEDFTILTAAVDAADLTATLDGNRQFTVFAPTDDAFVDLLADLDVSAEDLLADTELLTTVLLYHVAYGERFAVDVVESDRIRTVEGSFAWITVDDGDVFIDDSQVVAADIDVDNGVIHVIDRVLLPF